MFLTYRFLSSYILLRSGKQKKCLIFQSAFQKTSLRPEGFCSVKSFQAAGWPRLATTFPLTGIPFTGIHERDPMIKIYFSPVSQIQFPTKGTNTARWLQIRSRKIVQVKTSSLACYLTYFVFNKYLNQKESKQTLNSCMNFVQLHSMLISL